MSHLQLKTIDYGLMTIDDGLTTNNSVNFLIPHCFFSLHLTLKLVFGMSFRGFLAISRYKQNTKANVTLINVFLQAKI